MYVATQYVKDEREEKKPFGFMPGRGTLFAAVHLMEKYWEMRKKPYIISSLREAIIVERHGRRVSMGNRVCQKTIYLSLDTLCTINCRRKSNALYDCHTRYRRWSVSVRVET